MLKLEKVCVCYFILLQTINLVAAEELENASRNSTLVGDGSWTKNVSLIEKQKSAEQQQSTAIEKDISDKAETEVEPNPVNIVDTSLKATNRTGRQLYYSPNFFFIQNYASERSKCVTSSGSAGVCMTFNSCVQAHRHKRQSIPILSVQQWPPAQPILPYFQQQPEFCTYYDKFQRPSYGMCCVEPQNVDPTQAPHVDMPYKPETSDGQGLQKPENGEDSEVLEADLNSFQPEPPVYDNTDNTIDYDPIENLKQAAWLSNNNNNYIRYPWPQQFVGFSGVQQWPPPIPTHPPAIASWPPPLPTHPPNHHYPTHPPLNGGSGASHFYPTTSTTTRRPIHHRPTAASSSTTTTSTKKPDLSGAASLGLPLQCGLRNIENPDQERIVGGTNASPHEFPWIAVLFKSGKQFCGGSLITNNHILTAAHCVARMTSWDVAALTAHLGDYNIRTDFEVKHISRRIKRLVRHKGFDFSTLHNDIAILTLSEPVQYTKEIQPICLPISTAQQTRSYSGQIATVAGWGSLREDGPQPSVLQKVQIPIWTNAECAQKYGRAAPGGIITSMICAGQVAKDSCSGDSGGPLVVSDGARYIQVGIVSWGIGCGKGQYPGVYTRITSLLPWIYKNIK